MDANLRDARQLCACSSLLLPEADRNTSTRQLFPYSSLLACITLLNGILLLTGTVSAQEASFRTSNFVVTAPSRDIAEKVAKCAEFWREDLALQWLGETLPNWYHPCPISVKVGQIGAGGSTTFTFDKGEVYGWNMKVQGTLERILDSVIPHEVNHTIFASYFRRPIPRWADEGAATLFEHGSEQARQVATLDRVVKTSRRIPLQELLTIKEYPQDMQDVLTLYAEGYSLARFLVEGAGERGLRTYLSFLEDAFKQDWEPAIRKHYGFESIAQLERAWTDWVLAGSPRRSAPQGTQLASNSSAATNAVAKANVAESTVTDSAATDLSSSPGAEAVVRGQSPQQQEPLAMIPRPLREATGHAAVAPPTRNNPAETPAAHPHPTTSSTTARGDAGEPRLQPGRTGSTPTALPRESLSPTADGISSNPRAPSYAFPKMRAF